MTEVFVLQHVAREGSDSEDIKFIGVYSTESAAREAIHRPMPQPGFTDYPNGFRIDRYERDHDHWVEGFISEQSVTGWFWHESRHYNRPHGGLLQLGSDGPFFRFRPPTVPGLEWLLLARPEQLRV